MQSSWKSAFFLDTYHNEDAKHCSTNLGKDVCHAPDYSHMSCEQCRQRDCWVEVASRDVCSYEDCIARVASV